MSTISISGAAVCAKAAGAQPKDERGYQQRRVIST